MAGGRPEVRLFRCVLGQRVVVCERHMSKCSLSQGMARMRKWPAQLHVSGRRSQMHERRHRRPTSSSRGLVD